MQIVVRGLCGGLLLARLLSTFVAPAEPAREPAHRGTSGGAFTRVARDGATDRTERRTTSGAFNDVRL